MVLGSGVNSRVRLKKEREMKRVWVCLVVASIAIVCAFMQFRASYASSCNNCGCPGTTYVLVGRGSDTPGRPSCYRKTSWHYDAARKQCVYVEEIVWLSTPPYPIVGDESVLPYSLLQ